MEFLHSAIVLNRWSTTHSTICLRFEEKWKRLTQDTHIYTQKRVHVQTENEWNLIHQLFFFFLRNVCLSHIHLIHVYYHTKSEHRRHRSSRINIITMTIFKHHHCFSQQFWEIVFAFIIGFVGGFIYLFCTSFLQMKLG